MFTVPSTFSYATIANHKITEGDFISFDLALAFADANLGTSLSYSIAVKDGIHHSSIPSWLSLNQEQAVLSGVSEAREWDSDVIYELSITATNTDNANLTTTRSCYLYISDVYELPDVEHLYHDQASIISPLVYGSSRVKATEISLLGIEEPYTQQDTVEHDNGDITQTTSNLFGYNRQVTYTDATNTNEVHTSYADGSWSKIVIVEASNSITEVNLTTSTGTDLSINEQEYIVDEYTYTDNVIKGSSYFSGTLISIDLQYTEAQSNALAYSGIKTALGSIIWDEATYNGFTTTSEKLVFESTGTSGLVNKLTSGSVFVTLPSMQGVYGSLWFTPSDYTSILQSGFIESFTWTYQLDLDDPDTQSLAPGQLAYDQFTLTINDGTSITDSSISVPVIGQIRMASSYNSSPIVGNSVNDNLAGDNSDNMLEGKGGNDFIHGKAGNDHLFAGTGADLLIGGLGSDHFTLSPDAIWNSGIYAYNGATYTDIGAREQIHLDGYNRFTDITIGHELAQNDTGYDTVELTSGDDAYFLNDHLSTFQQHSSLGNTATPQVQRFQQIEAIYAGAGDDLLDATISLDAPSLDIALYGEEGNDILWGGTKDDVIYGGNGDDVIIGGAGADTLFGGKGNDTFKFTSTCGSDQLADFNLIEGDAIHLLYMNSQIGDSTMSEASKQSWLENTLTINTDNNTITWSLDESSDVVLSFSNQRITQEGLWYLLYDDVISFHEII